jgi:hypothetical protein
LEAKSAWPRKHVSNLVASAALLNIVVQYLIRSLASCSLLGYVSSSRYSVLASGKDE